MRLLYSFITDIRTQQKSGPRWRIMRATSNCSTPLLLPSPALRALFSIPFDPPALVRIAGNLRRALILLRRRADADLAAYGLIEVLPELRTLSVLDRTAALSEAIQHRNPMLGRGATDYPLYTSLWHTHTDPDLRDTYAMLQGHFAIATALSHAEAQDRSDHSPEEYPAYPASLAVRYLCINSLAANALLQAMPVALAPEQFAAELDKVSPPHSREAEIRLRQLQRYFGKIHNKTPYSRRLVNRTGGVGGSSWLLDNGRGMDALSIQVLTLGNPDNPSGSGDYCLRLTQGSIDPLLRTKSLNEDSSPLEPTGNDDLDIFEVDEPEEGHAESKPPQLSMMATNQIRAINRPEHLMPWSGHLLAPSELSPLMKHTERLLAADTSAPLSELLATGILQTSFWCGREPEDAAHLRCFLQGIPNEEADIAVLLGDDADGSNDWLRIAALRPPYRSADMQIGGQAYTPQDYVWLPLLSILGRLYRATIERKRQLMDAGGTLPSARLFPWNESLRKAVRDLLHRLNPGGRLTAARIRDTLPGLLIVRSGGDVALASLVFGREYPLASVELFYDGIKSDEAIQAYWDLVQELAEQWGLGSQHNLELCPGGAGYIGCRNTPTTEALVAAIAHVRDEARKILRYGGISIPYKDEEFIRAHNFYTLYLTWWLGYACAIRGVSTPLIDPLDVDPKTGLCAWSDKDDGSGYKDRLIWVPQSLLREIFRYAAHIKRLCHTMVLDERWNSLAGFFLDDRGRPTFIRPASIARITDKFFGFPANTHRRYLKQELRRLGCPPEVVRFLMGHWYGDQEPWSPVSSLSVSDLLDAFARYIPPMLDFLGFEELTVKEAKHAPN